MNAHDPVVLSWATSPSGAGAPCRIYNRRTGKSANAGCIAARGSSSRTALAWSLVLVIVGALIAHGTAFIAGATAADNSSRHSSASFFGWGLGTVLVGVTHFLGDQRTYLKARGYERSASAGT
ncbi:MAG: hypothetical protein WDO69_12685 [Pseudomonadota bacterium]